MVVGLSTTFVPPVPLSLPVALLLWPAVVLFCALGLAAAGSSALRHPRRAVRPLLSPRVPRLVAPRMSSLWSWVAPLAKSGSGRAKPQLSPRDKLQGYHQLAQEAFDRAYAADASGQVAAAAKLYRTGMEAAQEGLALQVEGTGLGPKADSVTGWKHDLQQWQRQASNRMRVLESGSASTSAPVKLTSSAYGPGSVSVPVRSPSAGRVQGPISGVQPLSRAPSGGLGQRPTGAQLRPQLTGNGSGGGAAAQRGAAGTTAPPPATAGGRQAAGAASPARDDQKYRDVVLGEILTSTGNVKWDDIAGLGTAKQALMEAVILPALRPDLFQGLRAPVRGILLYGPPGNGKTMLGKALASEARATFFNISASSLVSKWVGDGEKLVRALFEVAAEHQPSIIFIDEIDSILSARGKQNESDAARRLLTEFLVQFDGVGGAGRERVVVIGATNRPAELDDAVRRRLTKRIYVALPDGDGRAAVLQHLLNGQPMRLSQSDVSRIVRATEGYSASDLAALCKEAAMVPVRELGPKIAVVPANQVRPITVRDFGTALEVIKPSVNVAALQAFEKFTHEFGTQ